MIKDNKWLHGKHEFIAPFLAKELKGAMGCFFQEGVFDPEVREEIYLIILEDHQFSENLASLKSFNLFCKNGVGRTSYGVVAFLVFSVYDSSEYISAYELFLNPQKMETIRLLSSLGLQPHLKVIIFDSERDCLRDLLEFENVFAFQDFVGTLAQVIGSEPEGDFSKA